MSNEQRAPAYLGSVGDGILPSYMEDYFINHEIRIPMKQSIGRNEIHSPKLTAGTLKMIAVRNFLSMIVIFRRPPDISFQLVCVIVVNIPAFNVTAYSLAYLIHKTVGARFCW